MITVKNTKTGLFRLVSGRGLMAPSGLAALLALLSAPAAYAADEGDAGNTDASSTPSESEETDESEKVPEVKIDQSGGKDPLTGVWLGRSGKRQEMHTISDRTVGAEGRSEISLFGSYQVNPKWTQHSGLGLDYAFHPREAVGFTVGGSWNLFAAQSPFLETELYKALLTPPSANAVLLNWEAHVGVTMTPIYGKYSLLGTNLGHFGLYFGAGIGLGDTSVELRPLDMDRNGKLSKTEQDDNGKPGVANYRVYGNVGIRPVGLFSIGFRTFFGENFALRAEIRDTLFSNSVNTVNGCNAADLEGLSTGGEAGKSCQSKAFPQTQTDAQLAGDLVKKERITAGDITIEPSPSYVVHNLMFNLAFSFLF